MSLIKKKQRKVRVTAKKKEKSNRKLNKHILELEAENKRLKNAIREFGNNPAGFDWAVLERIEDLEEALGLVNSMILSGEKHSKKSKFMIDKALKG